MNNSKLHIVIAIMLILPFAVYGQEQWENTAGSGGIEDAQVVIEKDKIIKLRPVSRRFKAIQIEIPQVKPLTLTYSLLQAKDSLPSLQVIVRPKTMRDQPLDKLYGLVAKLGYGNYQSPYVLLNASTKRSDEYFLNGYFNHYSSGKGPVLDDFSGAGITNVGASGKYFLNNYAIYSSANYKYQTYSIYGYDPIEVNMVPLDRDFLKQKLNVFSFNIGLVENNLKNDLDHDLNLGINTLSNNHSVSEFIFDAMYKLTAKLSDEWSIRTDVNFATFSQNGAASTDISRRYIQLKPVVGYSKDKLSLNAGINIVNENDPISTASSTFHFLPVLEASYNLTNDHRVKALLGGSVDKISLNSLYNENPYLDSLVQANNDINNIAGTLMLEGKLSSKIGYSLSYQYKHYNRLMFYQNDAVDTARFKIVYDQGGATLNRFYGSITYIVNENINITGDVGYNAYNVVDLVEPWHKPSLEMSVTSNFTIIPKLRGHLTYYLLNGIKAQSASGLTKSLSTINDLNFGLELSLTERAGIFVDLMNVFRSNYQLYNNYPVKGFQIIGGLSYKF